MASINLCYDKFKDKVSSEQLVTDTHETNDFYLLLAYGPRTEWQCRIYKDSPDEAAYLLDLNA